MCDNFLSAWQVYHVIFNQDFPKHLDICGILRQNDIMDPVTALLPKGISIFPDQPRRQYG